MRASHKKRTLTFGVVAAAALFLAACGGSSSSSTQSSKTFGVNADAPPTNYAEIVADSAKISALGHGIYGFSFAGNCQGCLGFTMLPSLWAVGTHLIKGPLGTQTANVANDAPLKTMLQDYHL